MDAMKLLVCQAVAEAVAKAVGDMRSGGLSCFGDLREISVTRPSKLITQVMVKQGGKPPRFFEISVKEPVS